MLRDKYQVERLLGQGGMAYVVSAWHVHLEQRVAIKLLRPEIALQPEVVERFLREARAASRLEDGHVARVLDVDVLDSGPPFIVMEYLEGKDLAQVLTDHAPIAPHLVAGWVRQACSAIAEAHALGIIHRDLKPANLFLSQKRTGEPIVKVLDFGISKLLEDTRITRTEVGMGSAEYMSPEQMRSAADVDTRCDIWSLGVTLYELCTGTTPFRADGVSQVAAAVLMRDPVPPRQLRPDVPAALEAVILRCLEKDPARRYGTVQDLATDLEPLASAPGSSRFAVASPPSVRAIPPTRVSEAVPEPPARAISALAGLPPPVPQSSSSNALGIAVGIAVAVLAVVVVVLAFVLGRKSDPAPAAAASPGRFKLDATTLHDQETHLTWQRLPAPGTMDWAGAKDYCAHQRGLQRLPDIEELAGLVAFTRVSPPLDPDNFSTTAVDVFWSSSSAGQGAASVVHFSTGRTGTSVISGRNRVRCVH